MVKCCIGRTEQSLALTLCFYKVLKQTVLSRQQAGQLWDPHGIKPAGNVNKS